MADGPKYFFTPSNVENGLLLSTEPYINGNTLYASAMYCRLRPDSPLTARLMRSILAMEVSPGLFSRYPDRIENTSVDDYLAAVCIPEVAARVVAYGRKHFGFYDCVSKSPARKQFLWRFVGWWIHAKISAGEKINWIEKLIWSWSVKSGEKSESLDAKIQAALMRVVAGQKPDPNTWKHVATYITTEDHPLVRAWKQYDGMPDDS